MFQDVGVLIVEDDPGTGMLIRRVTESMTFDTTCVSSVRDAISKISAADILVVDIVLPNGTGRLLLERWTEMRKGPVVVTSGYLEEEEEDELLASRAWNVLCKPFSSNVFRAIMQRYGEIALMAKERNQLRVDLEQALQALEKQRRTSWIMFALAALIGMAGPSVVPQVLQVLIGLL